MQQSAPKIRIVPPTENFNSNHETINLLHAYGNMCKQRQCFVTGVVALKRALALAPDDPDLLCDLGALLWNYADYKAAYTVLKKSLHLRPTAVAHCNMGLTLASMGRFLTARDHHIEALKIHPEYMGSRWNLALLDLGMGNWERGLEEYECRMEYRGEVQYPKLPYPVWKGEDLNGKTIFVHGEQGIGDRILFSRYLAWLKNTYPDCTILHATIDECKRLMWDYRKIVQFVDPETPYRDIPADYHIFLLSLPRLAKSTPTNVPPDPGYIRSRVEPDKDLVIAFRDGGPLNPRQKSLKVGVRWSGNSYNEANDDRKIPFEFLLELAENPDVTLYSLQVGEGSERLTQLGAENICVNVGNAMASKGYIGSAMVMLHLDLVVTTCTSVAHLAGAMGIPTWVLLSSNPYWVWGNQGRTAPWYPSVRLYRQPSPGDWISVLEKVKSDLRALSQEYVKSRVR